MTQPTIIIKALADTISADFSGDPTALATDVTHDSRQVREGTVFVAIKGSTVDGHRFIDDVMRRGASGIISEQPRPDGFQGSWLRVENARKALAMAAAAVNGNPSHDLHLVGITGTNGKTTTTYLCFALAEAAGQFPAMLTTVEYRIGETSHEAVRTTPEASDTNRFLRQAVEAGSKVAVMEASSQAIDLHRCDGLRFEVAVFTNLTQDHLDYHGTMERYFEAKQKLFDGSLGSVPAASVINIDDEWGRKLAQLLRAAGQKTITTGQDSDADITGTNIEVSLVHGTTFDLNTPIGAARINSPLVGKPHVYNMLSAAGVAIELGYDLGVIKSAFEKCIGAPGRFERVPHDGDFAVIVDYAHTDDALRNTLRTAKDLTDGRIITVFGCGGDRDRSKRRPMGEVAGEFSDIAIITSDNPRNEDPLKIIASIEEGVRSKTDAYEVVSDRREAIGRAIALAEKGDVVIIAGKGHENYQIIGGDKFHFDDREAAAESLARRSEAV
ncbi:MAG: UDP-N-acetylmuramoyl-L-alanyl-D-glutamate--2,6-diaminopimelate ligase [Acidobacteria bacterium]|nr:UDP-N-acetylmuramoyl-L-alanyl-D-glutamate--2,6-diaminopimelate ligase [Pyrinomonadaceae bacterium]RIJ91223.1 MAG: UDP-N-acetylmuramoyl-L-alanyl-D-glutamate--2,6-diaminopimelate ligase [Acidobacteriota bacterium]